MLQKKSPYIKGTRQKKQTCFLYTISTLEVLSTSNLLTLKSPDEMKQKKCCSVRADKASLYLLAFDRTVSASRQVFLDKVLKSSEDLTAVYLCE